MGIVSKFVAMFLRVILLSCLRVEQEGTQPILHGSGQGVRRPNKACRSFTRRNCDEDGVDIDEAPLRLF